MITGTFVGTDLREELEPGHSGHIDIRQYENELGVAEALVGPIERLRSRESEFHEEATLPEVPPNAPCRSSQP